MVFCCTVNACFEALFSCLAFYRKTGYLLCQVLNFTIFYLVFGRVFRLPKISAYLDSYARGATMDRAMNVMVPTNPRRLDRALLKKAGLVVKQSMQGRMRVRVKSLRHREDGCMWMQGRLRQFPGVLSVETRLLSGSVIVYFDPEKTSGKLLLLEMAEQVFRPVLYEHQASPDIQDSSLRSCACSCGQEKAISGKLRRVLFLSGFMAYSLVRTWFFRLPVVQTPFSLLGFVAIAGTVPLLKEALRDTLEKKRLSVKPFLALGSMTTVFMGEAFSALQILWIYNVAELTEEYVAQKSRQAIRDILEIEPQNAYVLRDGVEVETVVADIVPGDVVVVHTGEKMPVDGRVNSGEALVDEASINGRSETVLHVAGDRVFAGTIVSQGILFVTTEKTGEDTYLAHIARMVEESMANRAPVEQKADQLAARLLKIGLFATGLTLLLTADPLRALTVMLVMSCPCATVLAASSAVTAALANAARYSILIKGGLYLEKIGDAEVYCLDKTGTLTSEEPAVVVIYTQRKAISEDDVVLMAATAESHNKHPMAKAILAEASRRGLEPRPHAVCDFKAGRGVRCTIPDKSEILVGSQRFMEENSINVRGFSGRARTQKELGNTVVYVAQNSKVVGVIGVANPIRPEAVRILHYLKKDGVKQFHLVTGDIEEVAVSMMRLFPFDDCKAALMPEDKAEHIKALQQKGSVVMVGDGVNDALALSHADIGVAMGAAGAEVAMEAADIALADSNLEGLVRVRNLSRKTLEVIEQNHYFAVSTDLFGAALGMMGLISPIMAGLIHILHTGGILINSGRLLTWEPPAVEQGGLEAAGGEDAQMADGSTATESM